MVIPFIHALFSTWDLIFVDLLLKLDLVFLLIFLSAWNLSFANKVLDLIYPLLHGVLLLTNLNCLVYVFFKCTTLGAKNFKYSWSALISTHRMNILKKKLEVKMNYSFYFNLGLNLIMCWIFWRKYKVLRSLQGSFLWKTNKCDSFEDSKI